MQSSSRIIVYEIYPFFPYHLQVPDSYLLKQGAIKKKISTSGNNPSGPRVIGFNDFSKLCFANGIVKTMLTVTQNTRSDIQCAIAGYQAMDAVVYLFRVGTIPERCALLSQLLVHNAVQICLAVCAIYYVHFFVLT
jgi:hypothetical protein